MPVANRGWLRLTPAGAPHPPRDYLKAQPPACSTQGASLAIIALFIVICIGARYLYSNRRFSRSANLAYPLVAHTFGNVDTNAAKQGPGPVVDEDDRAGKNAGDTSTMGPMKTELVRLADDHVVQRTTPLAIDPQWNKSMDASSIGLMSRRPPPPPLTPPELSSSDFTFSPRPHSDRRDSFMHQPNPDYMSSTASPTSQPSSSSPVSTRRRSYTKMIQKNHLSSQTSSPAEQESTDISFLSSSYPPTTNLLPPPPPSLKPVENEPQDARQVEVQGEIISVLDSHGAGWTRHTRVYGGGVCLACAATGGNHGGGFYGANVSPEEMH